MSISGVSSLNSYYTSSLSGAFSSTSTSEDEEQGKVGKPDKPPQGPPPGPPPGEGTQINSEDDTEKSWDSEDLTKFTQYASDEYGVDLDVEELMTEYDSDGDGVLSESDVQSLLDDNGIELPPPPPKPPTSNSVEEQTGMMAQMQSTTSISADTFNILDYLSEDEEDEDESVSAINLEARTMKIEDFLSEDEDEEEVDSVELKEQDLTKARQQERMFEAYKQQTDYTNYSSDLQSSLFFA